MVLQQLKPQKMQLFILERIYYIILITVHFLYNLYTSIQGWRLLYWQDVKRNLSSCWKYGVGSSNGSNCDGENYNYGSSLVEISRIVSRLSKIPKHIAISVSIEKGNYFIGPTGHSGEPCSSGNGEVIDLQALAKLITWVWVSQASVISLYDHHGQLKTMSKDLENLIQREFNRCSTENLSNITKSSISISATTPIIKFHNHNQSRDADSLYTNGSKSSRTTLHIILLSVEDGRQNIIQSAQDLFHENFELVQHQQQQKDQAKIKITEDKLDSTIKKSQKQWWIRNELENNCPMDPELLIILGNVHSTLGYPPWHIRLTEIQWIPPLKIIESKDFLKALVSYSKCQQRFGT